MTTYCLSGLCCPSPVGALWLFRLHLALLVVSMLSFVFLPFYRCCGQDDTRHRLVAAQTVQCLIFSLIFDCCACTQVIAS